MRLVDQVTEATVRAELAGDLSCEWCSRDGATRYRRVKGSAFDHVDLCEACARGLRAAVSRELGRADKRDAHEAAE